MTSTETPFQLVDPAAARLDFDAHAAGFAKALAHLDHAAIKELDRVNFDAKLRELVLVLQGMGEHDFVTLPDQHRQ